MARLSVSSEVVWEESTIVLQEGSLIIGSGMKMYPTLAESREWMKTVAASAPRHEDLFLFTLPPFPALRDAAAILAESPVYFGGQNMFWEDRGAYTGEVSPLMLKECGASLVELGHSERRTFFNETDETVNLKVRAAVRHGLIPILCIGEAQREGSRSDELLANQLAVAFREVSFELWPQVLVAYEPVWSIGKAKPASPDYLADRVQALKVWLKAQNPSHGDAVKILYGGSVSEPYVADLIKIDGVSGLFIGRAALDPRAFLTIVNLAYSNWLRKISKHSA